MNRIDQEHRRRNTESRLRWECYAQHRRHVTDLLIAAHVREGERLCVLGAGNCNDLELDTLTKTFSQVHLVDLDQEALDEGARSQALTEPGRVFLHGGIDLAGINEIIDPWSKGQPPAGDDVQRCLDRSSSQAAPPLDEPFDVVASVCLLTQLYDSVALRLDGDHPRFLELLASIRLRHVRLLFELVRPGGAVLLITDFVSSGTYPPLATTSEADLPAVAAKLIGARNFFTGANPGVLHALFKTDAVVAPRVSQLEMSPPWLWDFGSRAYAVCAIVARTSSTPPVSP